MKGKTSLFVTFWVALSAIAIISCDPFENDAIPQNNQVVLTKANRQYFILPNSTAVIDLSSFVQSSFANINLRVTTEPGKGKLTRLGDQLLKYEPRPDFIEGKDQFIFSAISSIGAVIKSDTIFVTMKSSVNDFSCQLIAVEDFVSIKTGTSTSINFLKNDRICGSGSNNLTATIHSEPKFGTVILSNDELVYTAKPGYKGWDEFVYKIVSKDGEQGKGSLGLVSVLTDDEPCDFNLTNDLFRRRILQASVIEFNVLENDIVCRIDTRQLMPVILKAPKYGVAVPSGNGKIHYTNTSLPNSNITDSVVYQICYRGNCKQATSRFNLLKADKGPGLYIHAEYSGGKQLWITIEFKPETSPGSGRYSNQNGGCSQGFSGDTEYFIPANSSNGKYAIEYTLTDYQNLNSAIKANFDVIFDFVEVSYEGVLNQSLQFTGFDLLDYWEGPRAAQYLEKSGFNFPDVSEIKFEVPSETDLSFDLTWDIRSETKGDVSLGMVLIYSKDCNGFKTVVSLEHSPFTNRVLADGDYLLYVVYCSGTASNVQFAVTISAKDGTWEGGNKEVSVSASGSSASLRMPFELSEDGDFPAPTVRFRKFGTYFELINL